MPRKRLPIGIQTLREIREQLGLNQAALGIRCEQPTIDGAFAELIRLAHAKTGERVVVLVDVLTERGFFTPNLAKLRAAMPRNIAPRGCRSI